MHVGTASPPLSRRRNCLAHHHEDRGAPQRTFGALACSALGARLGWLALTMEEVTEESKAADGADGERKEQEEARQEPSDMFRVVARFIKRGGDAQATAARLAEWLATRGKAWRRAHTFRKGDAVAGHGLVHGHGAVLRAAAFGRVVHSTPLVLSSSLRPVLEVDFVAKGQAARLKQLHDDARLDGMWSVFVVWCTSHCCPMRPAAA